MRAKIVASGLTIAVAAETVDVESKCSTGVVKTVMADGCSGTGDYCGLMAALTDPNLAADTVLLLEDGTHTLPSPTGISVSGIKICGTSRDKTIVDADALPRVFNILADNVGIYRMTIKNEYSSDSLEGPIWGYTQYIKNFQMSQVDLTYTQYNGLGIYGEDFEISDNFFLCGADLCVSDGANFIRLNGAVGDNRIVNNRIASKVLGTHRTQFVWLTKETSPPAYIQGTLTVSNNVHSAQDPTWSYVRNLRFMYVMNFQTANSGDTLSLVLEDNEVYAGDGFVVIAPMNDGEALALKDVTVGGNTVTANPFKCIVTIHRFGSGAFRTGSGLPIKLSGRNFMVKDNGDLLLPAEHNPSYPTCPGAFNGVACYFESGSTAETSEVVMSPLYPTCEYDDLSGLTRFSDLFSCSYNEQFDLTQCSSLTDKLTDVCETCVSDVIGAVSTANGECIKGLWDEHTVDSACLQQVVDDLSTSCWASFPSIPNPPTCGNDQVSGGFTDLFTDCDFVEPVDGLVDLSRCPGVTNHYSMECETCIETVIGDTECVLDLWKEGTLDECLQQVVDDLKTSCSASFADVDIPLACANEENISGIPSFVAMFACDYVEPQNNQFDFSQCASMNDYLTSGCGTCIQEVIGDATSTNGACIKNLWEKDIVDYCLNDVTDTIEVSCGASFAPAAVPITCEYDVVSGTTQITDLFADCNYATMDNHGFVHDTFDFSNCSQYHAELSLKCRICLEPILGLPDYVPGECFQSFWKDGQIGECMQKIVDDTFSTCAIKFADVQLPPPTCESDDLSNLSSVGDLFACPFIAPVDGQLQLSECASFTESLSSDCQKCVTGVFGDSTSANGACISSLWRDGEIGSCLQQAVTDLASACMASLAVPEPPSETTEEYRGSSSLPLTIACLASLVFAVLIH